MDKTDLLSTLAGSMPGYSKRQKKLAQYICDNCDKAAFLTADMLAKSAGVSESSVVRFSRQLGYEGYSDMRRAMQQVLRSRLSDMEAENEGSAPELLRGAAASEYNSIRSILCEQNEKGFEPVIHALAGAKRIYVQGMGALSGLALHMTLLLKNIELQARCLQSYEAATELFELGEGDVYVSVSSSLYSGRLSALHYAKDRGAVTVLICDEELTAGNKYADHRLYARGDAAILALCRAIVTALQKDSGVTADEMMRNIEEKRREYLAYEYEDM